MVYEKERKVKIYKTKKKNISENKFIKDLQSKYDSVS
jgi:hypothetical protein